MVQSSPADPKKVHVVQTWKHDRPTITCRFDPTGTYVLTGGEESMARRFTVSDGSMTALAGGHDSWVMSAACGVAGSSAVTGGAEGKLVWWDLSAPTPAPVRVVAAHQGWIRAIAVSPDGQRIASAGNDRVVRVWSGTDGSLIRELPGHGRDVYSLLFVDNDRLLSGDLMGVIKDWTVSSGQEVGTFDAKALHTYEAGQRVDFGGVRSLAVSPDRTLLAAGGLHKASNPLGAVHEPLVQLFKMETRELVRSQTVEGITQGVVWRLLFLSDGTLMGVCGGGNGGILAYWKPDADKEFHQFKLPNIARDVDSHPDGVQLVTAHHDGQVRLSRMAD
jgi:WD40 repeat protein